MPTFIKLTIKGSKEADGQHDWINMDLVRNFYRCGDFTAIIFHKYNEATDIEECHNTAAVAEPLQQLMLLMREALN